MSSAPLDGLIQALYPEDTCRKLRDHRQRVRLILVERPRQDQGHVGVVNGNDGDQRRDDSREKGREEMRFRGGQRVESVDDDQDLCRRVSAVRSVSQA